MKKIKLGDYIDILTDYHSGGSYQTLKEKTKILYEPDYAVMIRTLNFENIDFVDNLIYCDKSSYDFLSYSHVFEDDILMNKIANPGSVYLMPKVDYKVTCGMNLFLIRLKGVNQKYMYYVMKYNEPYIKSKAHGTTTKTITKEEVRSLEFYIHEDINEQNKIAEVLNSFDKLIFTNKQLQTNITKLTLGIYNYWYNQFNFPDKEGKPYKDNGGCFELNQELGIEIPIGWKVKKFSEVIVESPKSTVQVNEAKLSSGDIPFFTSGKAIYKWPEQMTCGRCCYLNTGGNADVKFYNGAASYSTDTWCLTAKEDIIDYLYLLIQSWGDSLGKVYFAGTGLKHLQKDLLKKTFILIPPEPIIKKFNEIIVPLHDKISLMMMDSFNYLDSRDKLMPHLFHDKLKL